MPPKKKRQRASRTNLDKARRVKQRLESGDASSSNLSLVSPVNLEVSGLSELLEMSDALDTDNESIDPSFDLDESLKCDTVHSLYCTLT